MAIKVKINNEEFNFNTIEETINFNRYNEINEKQEKLDLLKLEMLESNDQKKIIIQLEKELKNLNEKLQQMECDEINKNNI